MMLSELRKWRAFTTALTILVILLMSFQNCRHLSGGLLTLDSGTTSALNRSSGGGNGEPYGGMEKTFVYLMPGFHCLDSMGQPQSAFREKLFIDQGVITLVTNNCDSQTSRALTRDQIQWSDDRALFEDRLFLDFQHERGATVPNYLDPTFRWTEAECRSQAPSLMPGEAIHSLVMTTNYLGERVARVTARDALTRDVLRQSEEAVTLKDFGGSKQWSNDNISIFVNFRLGLGEFSFSRNGNAESHVLNCSLIAGP